MKPPALLSLALLVLFTTEIAGAQEGDTATHEEIARHRLELRPFGGWAVVPNSVTGGFVGADVSFRFNGYFALGLDGAWYAPFNRSAGSNPSYPLNETQYSANLDASFFLWPARARPGEAAGAFELYLVGGFGILESRPIAVVDPTDRYFSYNRLVDLSAGVGRRASFVGERVAVTLELRDLLYFENIENGRIPDDSSSPPIVADDPRNPDTFYDAATHVTNAIQLRLGARTSSSWAAEGAPGPAGPAFRMGLTTDGSRSFSGAAARGTRGTPGARPLDLRPVDSVRCRGARRRRPGGRARDSA